MKGYAERILEKFPVRHKNAEKLAFREWLIWELKAVGYSPQLDGSETCSYVNVVVGDPKRAKLVFTAHYDTGVREWIPTFISPTRPATMLLWQAFAALLYVLAAFMIAFAVTFLPDLPALTMPLFLILLAVVLFYPKFGAAEKRNANDNTSGVALVMEIMAALSARHRGDVAFVFLDRGADTHRGARAFSRQYADVLDVKTVFNFDCVGSGDTLYLYANKRSRWNGDLLDAMQGAYTAQRDKKCLVRWEGLYYFPSDNRKFRNHVSVCAVRHLSGFGYIVPMLHGKKGSVDEKNLSCLCSGTVKLIETYCK